MAVGPMCVCAAHMALMIGLLPLLPSDPLSASHAADDGSSEERSSPGPEEEKAAHLAASDREPRSISAHPGRKTYWTAYPIFPYVQSSC